MWPSDRWWETLRKQGYRFLRWAKVDGVVVVLARHQTSPLSYRVFTCEPEGCTHGDELHSLEMAEARFETEVEHWRPDR